MLYRYTFLAAGMLLFALPGVAQFYTYAPNAMQFCQLQKKYDSSLGGGFGRTLRSRSIELQAAFSPIRHGAVMVNYFDARRGAVTRQQEVGSSSHFAEFGIGAYEATAHGTASLFVGYGQGAIFNNYPLNRIASFDFRRWFIQPNIVYQRNRFECGIALRFNRLVYHHAEIDYSINTNDLQRVQAIESRSPFFLPELGLHAGIVFSPCTIMLNVTSLFYGGASFNFERLNHTLLLTLDLDSIYRRKKKPAADGIILQ